MAMDEVEIINGYGWSSEHQWLWMEFRTSIVWMEFRTSMVMERVENISGYG